MAPSSTLSTIHETRIQRLEQSGGVVVADLARVEVTVQGVKQDVADLLEDMVSRTDKILEAVKEGATATNAKIEETNEKIDKLSTRVVTLEDYNKSQQTKFSVAKIFGKYLSAPGFLIGGALLGKVAEKIWEWIIVAF